MAGAQLCSFERRQRPNRPTAAATPLEKRRKLMEAWACYCMRTEERPSVEALLVPVIELRPHSHPCPNDAVLNADVTPSATVVRRSEPRPITLLGGSNGNGKAKELARHLHWRTARLSGPKTVPMLMGSLRPSRADYLPSRSFMGLIRRLVMPFQVSYSRYPSARPRFQDTKTSGPSAQMERWSR